MLFGGLPLTKARQVERTAGRKDSNNPTTQRFEVLGVSDTNCSAEHLLSSLRRQVVDHLLNMMAAVVSTVAMAMAVLSLFVTRRSLFSVTLI